MDGALGRRKRPSGAPDRTAELPETEEVQALGTADGQVRVRTTAALVPSVLSTPTPGRALPGEANREAQGQPKTGDKCALWMAGQPPPSLHRKEGPS